MIKPGIYAATVTVQTDERLGDMACRFGKSKAKENGGSTPFVIVKFTIIRGPFARQSITWFGYFTDKTEDTTLKALRSCGFAGDDIDKFCDQRPDQEVELVIEMKPGQGDKPARPHVRWVNAVNRGIKLEAPIAGADLRKFSATLKAKLKGIPVVSGPKAVIDDSQAAAPADEGHASPPDDGGGHPAEDPADQVPF